MCKVRKKHLLAVNGLMWTAIGTKIMVTGVSHYLAARPEQLVWMIPLSLLVFAGFYLMFTGISRKYSDRIHALPAGPVPVFNDFPSVGMRFRAENRLAFCRCSF